jgi:hypothetical protein
MLSAQIFTLEITFPRIINSQNITQNVTRQSAKERAWE